MKHIKLFEDLFRKKKYIGQCDILRMMSQYNENNWQEMMKNKKKISFSKFIKHCSVDGFLDDGETMSDYINDSLKEDSDTSAYTSKWSDKDCMFLQTAGFEFIFI